RDIHLQLTDHDPEALLATFSQDARVLSEHRGLQFVHTHDGAGMVRVEPRWLRRVLLNLLANALNASPAGGTVTLRSVVSDGSWRVSVEDQGPGVEEGLRERIFERFFRVANALDIDGGSGLGLAICRSIISLHGGCVWADAAPASGLRVTFTIPAAT
ncbi:MAG: cusS, partial [Gammaproteobacteria bacterium]|nr:cusS [Gammaproteobacteria bacterium]